ncbi:MAG: DNA-processing protein DprA [Thermoplasmatales archaeon]|nr:DNA-processing protein DprA [Thermoplasmatales archaeon]
MSPIDEEEELAWIALHESKKMRASDVEFIVSKLGSMSAFFNLSDSILRKELGESQESNIRNRKYIDPRRYKKILTDLLQDGFSIIRYIDAEYPTGLKNVQGNEEPPLLLYWKGQTPKFEKCIAVVGTRQCSHMGFETARAISAELARRGYTIVSGLARGIDASAHHGALSVNGITIAVLPWVEKPYPPEHANLLYDIVRSGGETSENYLQREVSEKYRFVERNRIISGISDYIIAVESGETGGTKWQVDIALRQGKRVLAFKPPSDNSVAMKGYLSFIDKGAKSVASIEDIVGMLKDSTVNDQNRGQIDSW